jgi:nucleotide-binding universal stress UspA family protein
MSDLRSICCAIDFSDASLRAMHWAAALANRLRAGLTLLHVSGHLPASSAAPFGPPPRGTGALLRERQLLAEWEEEADGRAPSAVRSILLGGPPAEVIADYVREGAFDLLVLGSHGFQRGARHVLGPVAAEVVARVDCPVMVVRQNGLDPVPAAVAVSGLC